MSAKQLGGDGENFLVATDGVRTEVIESGEVPEWATLYWWLQDHPEGRADWNRLRGYHHTAPNKLSKTDQ